MWLLDLMRFELSRPWPRGSGPAALVTETKGFPAPGWCCRVSVVCVVSVVRVGIAVVHHYYVSFPISQRWQGVEC